MISIGIISALEREIRPLIRGWELRKIEHGGRRYRFFESENAVAVSSGIGPDAGRRAAHVLLDVFHPKLLCSVGLAGSLSANLKIGYTFLASQVFDADTGKSWPTLGGEYAVVSATSILGYEEKRRLAERFGAKAVDMEAAAVAEVAAHANVPFMAVKAISDELDFPMPPMNRFVGRDGSFAMASFALYALTRPALWPAVLRLGRNSVKAAQALAPMVRRLIDNLDFNSFRIESK